MINRVFSLLSSSSAVLWDFDGVIIDSNLVRSRAFRSVLRGFSTCQVDELIRFHDDNGGLSRYAKFAFFQQEILRVSIDEGQIRDWAAEFSTICRKELSDESTLIGLTTKMIDSLIGIVPQHIVSGSDQIELRALCAFYGISDRFASILGSPIPKLELVSGLMREYNYPPDNTWLIGDSENDYEAAKSNGLLFMGYRNSKLRRISDYYWTTENS